MSHFRPLQDHVLIERVKKADKSKGGTIIPDTAKEKPAEGRVIAVGNGKHLENGTVGTLTVKAGDHVLFGKYGGNEMKVDGAERILLREEDILAVIED